MADPTNPAFGAAVKRLIEGRSLRLVARTTGVSHSRISDMAFGVVPSYRLLERFTVALEVPRNDRDELFRLAGYAPPEEVGERGRVSEERGPLSNAERLTARIFELARLYPDLPELRISLQEGLGQLHRLDDAGMERLLDSVTRKAERLAEKKRNKQSDA